jgi:hypothetical protein
VAAKKKSKPRKRRQRRAVVLVPGMEHAERFAKRDILVRNMETVERYPLTTAEEVKIGGEKAIRLKSVVLRGAEGAGGPDIDIFEAYWFDLTNKPFTEGSKRKFRMGLGLLRYWLLSRRIWAALYESRFIAFGMVLSGALLVLWYFSIVIVAFNALGPDDNLLPRPDGLDLINGWTDALELKIRSWGDLKIWGSIAVLLTFFQADSLVRIAEFAKQYLLNAADETDVGLRDRVKMRVRAVLSAVFDSGYYDEVYVVGHSFGSVVAIDVLSGWGHPKDLEKMTLVTWGSPVAVLRHRSAWLRGQLENLRKSTGIRRWFDFHSRTDWMCTAIPPQDDGINPVSVDLNFEGSFTEKMTGGTHSLYYRNEQVLENLAVPVGRDRPRQIQHYKSSSSRSALVSPKPPSSK